ncbi:MAG: hypothetical protein M1596_04335 [Firmicutes bacterium]|jgi:hypothetical protein|nr:hypothetical protein [Bacillota bacterium]MCL5972459.1 hypothetical protein [Bacillota bacterium]
MTISWRELENIILRIPYIQGAHVVPDEEGHPKVHVLATAVQPPRHIIREVTALLRSVGFMNANADWVTVVQVHEEGDTAFSSTRLSIAGFAVGHNGSGIQATCRLNRGVEVFEAVAIGPSLAAAMAMATVGSVNEALARLDHLVFNGVDIIRSGGIEVVLVTVVESGNEVLSGSAVFRDTMEDSVIRATLDAVNRRFLVYTGQKV